MAFEIFLPCYFGNEVYVSHGKLSESIFHSDWTNESKEFKMAMTIFMENIKKPLKISAFGIFHVDLENFMTIMNSSYSLYAVFNNLKI